MPRRWLAEAHRLSRLLLSSRLTLGGTSRSSDHKTIAPCCPTPRSVDEPPSSASCSCSASALLPRCHSGLPVPLRSALHCWQTRIELHGIAGSCSNKGIGCRWWLKGKRKDRREASPLGALLSGFALRFSQLSRIGQYLMMTMVSNVRGWPTDHEVHPELASHRRLRRPLPSLSRDMFLHWQPGS